MSLGKRSGTEPFRNLLARTHRRRFHLGKLCFSESSRDGFGPISLAGRRGGSRGRDRRGRLGAGRCHRRNALPEVSALDQVGCAFEDGTFDNRLAGNMFTHVNNAGGVKTAAHRRPDSREYVERRAGAARTRSGLSSWHDACSWNMRRIHSSHSWLTPAARTAVKGALHLARSSERSADP